MHATVVFSIGGVNNWVRTNRSLPCLAAPAARSVLRLALVALTSAMVSGSCTLRRMKSTSSAGIRPNAMVHRQPRWPTKLYTTAASSAPSASPDIITPLALARCLLLDQASATSAAPIGSSTPEPIPAMNRNVTNSA